MTQLFNYRNLTKFIMSLVIFFCTCSIGFSQDNQLEAKADTLMEQRQFEKAIDLYSSVIKTSGLKEKSDFRPVYKRAIAYYYSEDFESSLKDLDVFLAQYPQVSQAHILRAFIYGQTGESEKQVESIGRAFELQPDNLELVKWRGSIQIQRGEYAKAKSDLLMVRSVMDDAELETNLALAYYSMEQADSAFQCINKSIELEAAYEPAYLYAGSFCLELEQYQRGIEYLDLALLLNSENASAWLYKGMALVQLKRTDEGCRLLTKAFNAGEDDAADYLKEYCYEVYK